MKIRPGHACALALLIPFPAPGAAQRLGGGPAGRSLDGVWASEGYGYVFEVKGLALKAFEVTTVSCIPTFTAGRQPDRPEGAEAAFKLSEAPVTFLVLTGSAPDKKRLHMNGAASDILVHRLPAPLPACHHLVPDTPEKNFEVFAWSWAEQYGFFGVRGVNWPKVVAENRPKVGPTTPSDSLFEILKGMIEPLEDAHTRISAPAINKQFHGSRKGPNRLEPSERPRAFEIVEQKYLRGPLRSWCMGQVQFGWLDGDVGYLRIKGFGRYTEEGSFESGLVALEAALDSMFADAGRLKGLVIDVRLNGGGADPYGLAIAARLATAQYEAYVKQARADRNDPTKWTAPQPSVVRPSARPGFKGKVVELIGIHSVSAAETFTQALLNRSPKVTRIGENTQGVFSDVLGRHLPNGWQFGLPNERFVTNGKAYDGPGIPPDIEVPVFPKSDLEAGRDGALEKALEVLGVRGKGT